MTKTGRALDKASEKLSDMLASYDFRDDLLNACETSIWPPEQDDFNYDVDCSGGDEGKVRRERLKAYKAEVKAAFKAIDKLQGTLDKVASLLTLAGVEHQAAVEALQYTGDDES